MLLYESDLDALDLDAGEYHLMELRFPDRDDPREMMLDRMRWLVEHETDGVLLASNMLTPLRAHFHERSVIEMMLMTRSCSYLRVGHDAYETIGILPLAGEHGEDMNGQRAADYRKAFPTMPGMGSLVPYVVFVGETPNPKTLDRTLEVPFSSGPSGEWLISSIGCIDSRCVAYVTNAVKANGDDRTVAREIRWLQPQAVVALGQVASKALRKAKIEHTTVHHPQYARRFHFKEQGTYVDQIRRAIYQSARDRA